MKSTKSKIYVEDHDVEDHDADNSLVNDHNVSQFFMKHERPRYQKVFYET